MPSIGFKTESSNVSCRRAQNVEVDFERLYTVCVENLGILETRHLLGDIYQDFSSQRRVDVAKTLIKMRDVIEQDQVESTALNFRKLNLLGEKMLPIEMLKFVLKNIAKMLSNAS